MNKPTNETKQTNKLINFKKLAIYVEIYLIILNKFQDIKFVFTSHI